MVAVETKPPSDPNECISDKEKEEDIQESNEEPHVLEEQQIPDSNNNEEQVVKEDNKENDENIDKEIEEEFNEDNKEENIAVETKPPSDPSLNTESVKKRKNKNPSKVTNHNKNRKDPPPFSLNGLIHNKMDYYNSLKDSHLQPFFSRTNRRKILIKNGLVTEEGYIVRKPEEYLKKKELYLKQFEEEEMERSHSPNKSKAGSPYK